VLEAVAEPAQADEGRQVGPDQKGADFTDQFRPKSFLKKMF
jgi:hypothetical protein